MGGLMGGSMDGLRGSLGVSCSLGLMQRTEKDSSCTY